LDGLNPQRTLARVEEDEVCAMINSHIQKEDSRQSFGRSSPLWPYIVDVWNVYIQARYEERHERLLALLQRVFGQKKCDIGIRTETLIFAFVQQWTSFVIAKLAKQVEAVRRLDRMPLEWKPEIPFLNEIYAVFGLFSRDCQQDLCIYPNRRGQFKKYSQLKSGDQLTHELIDTVCCFMHEADEYARRQSRSSYWYNIPAAEDLKDTLFYDGLKPFPEPVQVSETDVCAEIDNMINTLVTSNQTSRCETLRESIRWVFQNYFAQQPRRESCFPKIGKMKTKILWEIVMDQQRRDLLVEFAFMPLDKLGAFVSQADILGSVRTQLATGQGRLRQFQRRGATRPKL
jgi:hypothetical protein